MDSAIVQRILDSQIKTLLLAVVVAVIITDVRGQEDYQALALKLHNEHRSVHSVDPLKMNADLNDRAIQCAKYYIELGKNDHSCPHKNGAGENLYNRWGDPKPTNNEVVERSIFGWYKEEALHNYDMDVQRESGHFSQLVWKSSKELGFGVAFGEDNKAVGCALYSPPGNVVGRAAENVFPKTTSPSNVPSKDPSPSNVPNKGPSPSNARSAGDAAANVRGAVEPSSTVPSAAPTPFQDNGSTCLTLASIILMLINFN